MNRLLLSMDSAFRYSSLFPPSMNCVSELYFLTFQHSETLSIKMSNNFLGGVYVFFTCLRLGTSGRTFFSHEVFSSYSDQIFFSSSVE
jgi:hypothetical protein